MINPRYFLSRIKDVKIKDYLALVPMTIALIIKPLFSKRYNDYWLVCEEPAEARDNGYVFFKYLTKNTKQKCIYAIKRKSPDFKKVQVLGETVEYGSIKHWIIYFTSKYNISSQKGGKPNAALCSFFELNGLFTPRNIFLQHGIIINNLKWLYKDKSRIEIFITSTNQETEYVKNNFGYSDDVIQCTGMPRFDDYKNIKVHEKQIVIMPTWRYWFNLKSKQKNNNDSDFLESNYYKSWKIFLESDELNRIIKKYKLNIIFYLHRNLQRYSKYFNIIKTNVEIADWKQYDIRNLLKTSRLMITDYSSVFFDMVYMKKPIIFYQFDKEKYRNQQYEKGYFDYDNNCFGKTYVNYKDVCLELDRICERNFEPSKSFTKEHEHTFPHKDSKNSYRIYKMLKERQ